MPSLVWNKNKALYLENDRFSVFVITSFPMEINTCILMMGTTTYALNDYTVTAA